MLDTVHIWWVVAGAVVIVVLFLYCILLQTKINALTKRYDYFMAGESLCSWHIRW
jgi:type VI protein secretion system component VasF